MEPLPPLGDHLDRNPSGILDPIAFQAKTAGIEEAELQAALSLPRFRAAVAAFRRGLIPLGYAVSFVWPELVGGGEAPSPAHVADLICYAMRRAALDATDPRYISVDDAAARSAYPGLFEAEHPSRWRSAWERFEREMGDFAIGEPWRKQNSVFANIDIVESYAAYWLKHSQRRIEELLSDCRFMAAFDAYRQELLSYYGLLEKLYDAEHGDAIFPGLGREFQGIALRQLAEAANRGEILIPQDLQAEFPDFYSYYAPELHGKHR